MNNSIRASLAVVILVSMGAVSGCKLNAGGGGLGGGDQEDGYTILLAVFSSANHNNHAKYTRDALKADGWQDMMVVHKDSHSELLWGSYKAMSTTGSDLRKAREYTSQNGARPFAQARVVALPGQDVGPAEWKLTTTTGAYTVVVACYFDVYKKDFPDGEGPEDDFTGRRRRAVKFCKYLRDEGNEAYYHHGPVKSYITVGSLNEGAVTTVREDNKVKTVVSENVRAIIRKNPIFHENSYEKILLFKALPEPGKKLFRRRVVARPYPVKIPRQQGKDLPSSTHEGAGIWTVAS